MAIFRLLFVLVLLNLSCSDDGPVEQRRMVSSQNQAAPPEEITPDKKSGESADALKEKPPSSKDKADSDNSMTGKDGNPDPGPDPSPSPSPDPSPDPGLAPLTLKAMAIIGDSDSDEFRSNDNRGGTFSSVTFNWVELLVNRRSIELGPWETNSEPRRSGFAYNWARSGAVAQSMINSGQHTGVAAQIAEKKVNLIIMRIGVNDFHPFNGTYQDSYSNQSDAQLEAKTNGIINNLNAAVSVLVNAATAANVRIGVLVTHYGDPATSSLTAPLFPDANKRKRVSNAIDKINDAIDNFAIQYPKVVYPVSQKPYIDFTEENLTIAAPYPYITVEPGRVLYYNMDNHPKNLIMSDKHLGTIANGLIFNLLYQKPLKDFFGIDIQPFSNDELYHLVGLD